MKEGFRVGGRDVNHSAAFQEYRGLLGGTIPGSNGGLVDGPGFFAEAEVRESEEPCMGQGMPRPMCEVLQDPPPEPESP